MRPHSNLHDAFPRCAAAATVAEACEKLVDDLRELYPLPSVYLLVDGRLRCQAARGYYQVVDGFTPGIGVIGRVAPARLGRSTPLSRPRRAGGGDRR